jgi:hypothetical protein
MEHVPKIASGKISLARGIHCCPNFFDCFCPTSVSILCRTRGHIHISACVDIAYELPSLPNKTASETFVHKVRAMRSVGRIYIIGAMTWRWPRELDKTFYNLLFKREVEATPFTSILYFLSHSSRRSLLEIFIPCINYIIIIFINNNAVINKNLW